MISKQEMNYLRAVFNQNAISDLTIAEIFPKLIETTEEHKKGSAIWP